MNLLAHSIDFDIHRDWPLVAFIALIMLSYVLLHWLMAVRRRKVKAAWDKRASLCRVRLEFADGNAAELIGMAAQQWHRDMYFAHGVGAQPLSVNYFWKAVAPTGSVAAPTHPLKDVEDWAHGRKKDTLLDALWLMFERLFYQHERFDPNRRDSRAQDLFSWFYFGVQAVSPVPWPPAVTGGQATSPGDMGGTWMALDTVDEMERVLRAAASQLQRGIEIETRDKVASDIVDVVIKMNAFNASLRRASASTVAKPSPPSPAAA